VIVDASVALKWVVQEPGSTAAAALADAPLAAPELLLAECANALWAKARRGELSEEEARERTDALAAAPITWVPLGELVGSAIQLACALDHPVYDCLYLALAIRDADILVTADRHFVEAVAAAGEDYAAHVQPLTSAPQ